MPEPLRPASLRAVVRRPATWVNAALAVVVAGAGAAIWISFASPGQSVDGTAAGAVRTVPVTRGAVTATVSASGSVRSAATAEATFGTSGTVTEIRVQVGDVVKKGAVLAKVDPTATRRELAAAEADLEAAEAAYDRAADADSDTAEAEAQVAQAEAAVDEAEDAVAATTLKAPLAGTVVAVNGTVGGSSGGTSSGGSSNGSSTGGAQPNETGGDQTTGSGSAFIEIADTAQLEVAASVAEADATKLEPEQAATIAWNALDGVTADGALASIDPNATTSNNVVTYGVVFTMASVPVGVRLGQSVEVTVTVGEKPDVIAVSSAAVTTAGRRHTVTVLANGVEETRTVEVGLEGDTTTEVVSGLAEGDRVVLRTSDAGTGQQGGFPGGGFPGGGGVPGGGGLPGGGAIPGGGPGGGG